MGDNRPSSPRQVPDSNASFSPPLQLPNGELASIAPSAPATLPTRSVMDQQDPNEDANSALKLRVQELETQCARLTRKLAKTKLNSDKVAELVDLYNKTATELEQMKTQYNGLIEASEENFKRETDRLTQLLREAEKARAAADQHISEQSVLVSQLKNQLREVIAQRASTLDLGEAKKEVTKIRSELETKSRQLEKRDEKINMQKLEIANLTDRVKSLERSLRNANLGQSVVTAPASRSSTPSSLPEVATSVTPSTAPPTPTIVTPIVKRTRATSSSKSKNAAPPTPIILTRTPEQLEEDQLIGDEFMEEFSQFMESATDDGGDFTDSLPSPSAKKTGRKSRSKKRKSNASGSDMESDEEDEQWLPDILRAPSRTSTPSRQVTTRAKRNATPAPTSLDEILEPLGEATSVSPRSGTRQKRPRSPVSTPIQTSLGESNSDSLRMPPPRITPLPSTHGARTATSPTSTSSSPRTGTPAPKETQRRDNSMDVDANDEVLGESTIEYELQPVSIVWRPLRAFDPICDAICALISKYASELGDVSDGVGMEKAATSKSLSPEAKRDVSLLASNLCNARPGIIARAVIESLHRSFQPIHHQWEKHTLSERQMVKVLTHGAPFEPLLCALLLSTAHGSLCASPTRIVDSTLGALQAAIHFGSPQHARGSVGTLEKRRQEFVDLPDFVASAYVRLYVRLCREYGYLTRARTLLFDILREKEEICLSQLIGAVCAWPLVVESRCNSRSFLSCTIESILTAALTSDTSDSLLQLQREALKFVTGWRMESRKQLLVRWGDVLLTAASTFLLTSSPVPDAAAPYSVGLDIAHSLELIGAQLGWQFCAKRVWQPLVWPSLSSLPAQFASESTQSQQQNGDISTRATVLIKIATSIGRLGIESGQLTIRDASGLLLHLLNPHTPITFTVQLHAAQAVIDLILSQKADLRTTPEYAALRHWHATLAPLARRFMPPRMETILTT